jgi:hypothetical protein
MCSISETIFGDLMKIRNFVKNAPQYQQMPEGDFVWHLYRRFAGFLYFTKQFFLYGGDTIRKIGPLRSLKNLDRGVPALIIANGPSQNSLTFNQIERLRESGTKIFVMNSFFRNALSAKFSPDYYIMIDPILEDSSDLERIQVQSYLESNPLTTLVVPSTWQSSYSKLTKIIFVNGLSAVGLWRKTSSLLPSTHPQGVLFTALELAVHFGHTPIYVTGIDNSFYLNHFHNQYGKINIAMKGLHSYEDDDEVLPTKPFLTRNMSDVLYSHAIFLRDLRRLSYGKTIVNVGITDFTNDALAFACLLPQSDE